MSENTAATDLTAQYAAQLTDDLERNVKEQDRVSAEIAALQQQLAALQHNHVVLVNMQQALGMTPSPAAPAPSPTTTAAAPSGDPTVPAPRRKPAVESAAKKQTGPAKSAAGRARSAAGKAVGQKPARKPAKKTADRAVGATKATKTAKATEKVKAAEAGETAETTQSAKTAVRAGAAKKAATAGTTLVELVRRHLTGQKEPRSAAEVATALGQVHPERGIKTTVIRTTLEGLVARNQAQRSKQGTSVFYTAQDAAEAGTAEKSGTTAAVPAQKSAGTEQSESSGQKN
ncbi:hypothetical protein ACIHAA_18425 [Streptomyces sp. NPDC052040]|uniref:hypothetical protein n=1 Tax=unclassified Streptomyces TaxID=2593676 RepID=UPI0037D056D3